MKNISEILKKGIKALENFENAKLEAEVLLSEVLNVSRIFLKTHEDFELKETQEEKFLDFIDLRKHHIPVAYILGYVNWADFKILVDKNTLIPRDETEILCHHILEKNKFQKPIKNILDIGTGSGCIAIWMKKNFPKAEVSALDISEKALEIAQKNAKNNKSEIIFFKSDMLEKISKNSEFNIITANLPYVPENIEITLEVKKEPHSAIFSEEEGLFHIKKLRTELERKNIKFNQLWLEFLPQQEIFIKEIFENLKVEFFGDISGEIFFACISGK